jgi:hypothetical protein
MATEKATPKGKAPVRKAIDMNERDRSLFHSVGDFGGQCLAERKYTVSATTKNGTQEKTYSHFYAWENTDKKNLVCRAALDGGRRCDKHITKGASGSNMVTHLARCHPHLLTSEDQYVQRVGAFREDEQSTVRACNRYTSASIKLT